MAANARLRRSGTKATQKANKGPKQSGIVDPAYRAAYETIYDRNDYAAAIDQLKALGHDEHPNAANLIGYSYRRLGDYKLSQVWYERALSAHQRAEIADRRDARQEGVGAAAGLDETRQAAQPDGCA